MISIVIIGKGPSVKKSSSDFIDSFHEVAICNHPPYRGYENLISDHADYHFLNAGDPHPYDRTVLDGLGIKEIYNTSRWEKPPISSIMPTSGVMYYPRYGMEVIEYFKTEGFDEWGPSSGVMAFHRFVDEKDYDHICLVGFDFFEPGTKNYYFEKELANPSLHYLWQNGTYSNDGTILKSTHGGPEKTIDYILKKIREHPEKKFTIMSDYNWQEKYELRDSYENLKLL